MSATMLNPSQYADILPATSPERIPREAPPSLADVTTSCTWPDLVEVKTLTSSGMTAPARVPQEMMEVIQTSEVKGASKSISSEFAYFALAIAPLRKYAPELEISMATRMTKIHTSNCTCVLGS